VHQTIAINFSAESFAVINVTNPPLVSGGGRVHPRPALSIPLPQATFAPRHAFPGMTTNPRRNRTFLILLAPHERQRRRFEGGTGWLGRPRVELRPGNSTANSRPLL
jgi:hypothetical protein